MSSGTAIVHEFSEKDAKKVKLEEVLKGGRS